eukprot:9473996-Pyramimonas_sp.AAC.1
MQGSAGVARSVANARNGCRVHGSRKGEAFSQSFTLSPQVLTVCLFSGVGDRLASVIRPD